MIVVNPIYDNDDKILIRATNKINTLAMRKIRELGYAGVYIYEDDETPVNTNIISDELRIRAIRSLKKKDIDTCITIANLIAVDLYTQLVKLMETIYLSTAENYMYSHSINVCLLSVITGMGMKEGDLRMLAQAALLHDIGKWVVPQEIINKPATLTDKETDEAHRHSEYGYNILKDNDRIASVTRIAIYEHHENEDGTGYPRGLKKDQIHIFAKIIHIADVYDALTSKRCYNDAMNPADAMEYLMAHADKMFDINVLQVFMKHVALYPIGSTIELSNKQKATVVMNNSMYLNRPIVKTEADGRILNLLEHPNVTVLKLYK